MPRTTPPRQPSAHDSPSPQRRRYLKAAVAAPLAPALSGCEWWFGAGDDDEDGANRYPNTIADGRMAISQAMANSSASSISVALLDGDSVVWQQAFGEVDRDTGVAAGPDTLYNIGSCSKVLAAAAVMILVDRGRVGLDTPVTRYLPGFTMRAADYTRITVRMLLNHASGLPGVSPRNIFMFRAWSDYGRAMEAAQADLDLKAEPGAFSVYCNDGFTLAQRLVEEVSGTTYPQFVQDEIFGPLGMTLSRYALEAFPEGSYAHSYVGGVKRGQEFVLAYGTGGAASTPGDMMKLAAMFFNDGSYNGRRILSASSVREMARNQALNQPRYASLQFPWGLGWDSVAQAGLAAVGVSCWQKNGGTAFYGSDFFVLPRERMALMITGTSTDYGAGALGERILLNALAERKTISQVPQPLSRSAAGVTATDAQLEAMTGIFGNHVSLFRMVREGSQALVLQAWRDGGWQAVASNLRQRSDGWYASNDAPLQAYSMRAEGEQEFLLTRSPFGYGHYTLTVADAQRLQPRAALSTAWQQRLGRRWLLANEDWASVALALGGPGFTLASSPDLPGYVLIDGGQPTVPESDSRTRMVLSIPVNSGRDLFEVVVVNRAGGEWLRLNGQWYCPQATVAGLGAGSSVVQIGGDGLTEWRRLSAGGQLQVQGAFAAWKLYDQNLQLLAEGEGAGSVAAAQGQYLALFGEAGNSGSVVLG